MALIKDAGIDCRKYQDSATINNNRGFTILANEDRDFPSFVSYLDEKSVARLGKGSILAPGAFYIFFISFFSLF